MRDSERPCSTAPARPVRRSRVRSTRDTCIDDDGYGRDAGFGAAGCPSGATVNCHDDDAAVNPGAVESTSQGNCGNGTDDDCDGNTDAADPDC